MSDDDYEETKKQKLLVSKIEQKDGDDSQFRRGTYPVFTLVNNVTCFV